MRLAVLAALGYAALVVWLIKVLPTSQDRSIGAWWDTPPSVVGASALVLVVGLGLIGRLWVRSGRDLVARRARGRVPHLARLLVGEVVIAEYEPPAAIAPAEAGVLVDGCANTRHVTATLIDLAIRGHVTMREVADRGWILERTSTRNMPQHAFERTLLARLFADGPSVDLTDARAPFYWIVANAELELDERAVQNGWFLADPALLRRGRRLAGLGLTAIGLIVTAVLGIRLGAGLVGMAVVVPGIALTIVAGSMHTRTAVGHELMLRTRGFRLYLETAEGSAQRFAEHADLFTKYLPFAVAFGIAHEWAHRFDLAGTVYSHRWYTPASSDTLRHVELAERLRRFSTR